MVVHSVKPPALQSSAGLAKLSNVCAGIPKDSSLLAHWDQELLGHALQWARSKSISDLSGAYFSTRKCVAKQSDPWWFIIMSYYLTQLFSSFILCPSSISQAMAFWPSVSLTWCCNHIRRFSYIPFENFENLLTEQVLNCRGTKGKGHVVLRCPRDAKESGLLRLCLVAVRMSFTRACCYQTSKHPERSSKLDCLTDKTAN